MGVPSGLATALVLLVTVAAAAGDSAVRCETAATTEHVADQLRSFGARLDPLLLLHPSGLYEAYWTVDPLISAVAIALILAMYSFLVTEMSGNYSSVDRLWSVLPVLYTWHFYVHGAGDTRTLAMALLATVWGLRLSYNFWRKGGYSGEEDYRWPVLREIIGSDWRFTVFNLTFISTYQHLLLLAFVLPAYVSSECPGTPWGLLDYAAMALFLGLVVLETVADEQQWNFQQTKKQLANKDAKREGDFKLGFLTTGLFSLSRHPNFFAEQSIWWSFYLFAVSSSGVWLHWSVMGTVLLTLLFQGSTPFTESITKKRHPAYARYQKTTSRLVPWLPGPRLN